MRNFESFRTEKELLDRIEEYKKAGYRDSDLEIISKERVDAAYLNCVDCTINSRQDLDRNIQRDEPSLGDRIIAFFTGEDPEDRSFVNLDIEDEYREEVEDSVRAGNYVLFVDEKDNFENQDVIDRRNERVIGEDREYRDNIISDERIIEEDTVINEGKLLENRPAYVAPDDTLYSDYDEESPLDRGQNLERDSLFDNDVDLDELERSVAPEDPLSEQGKEVDDRVFGNPDGLVDYNTPLSPNTPLGEENLEDRNPLYVDPDGLVDDKPIDTDPLNDETLNRKEDTLFEDDGPIIRDRGVDRDFNIENEPPLNREVDRDAENPLDDIYERDAVARDRENVERFNENEGIDNPLDNVFEDDAKARQRDSNKQDPLYEIYGREETVIRDDDSVFDEVDEVIEREREIENPEDLERKEWEIENPDDLERRERNWDIEEPVEIDRREKDIEDPLGEDRETEDGTDPEFDQVDPLYMETVLDKNDPLLDSSRVDEDDVFADEIDRVDEFYDTESNFRENDLDRRRDYRKKNIEDVENTPVKPRRNYDDDTNI